MLQLVQFVTGGHETSATSLVLLTAVLAARSDCQERICQEIHATIEKHGDLDALAIEGMVYLNNFIREVFRVYSPCTSFPSFRYYSLPQDSLQGQSY